MTNAMKGEQLKIADIFVNQSTNTISEAAALWRGTGVNKYQSPHADDESGPFSMVEPLSNRYTIKIWPYSHLLFTTREFCYDRTKFSLTGGGVVPTLMFGDKLIFHSNLIHCGEPSCSLSV